MENSIKTVTIDMYAGLQLAPGLDNRPVKAHETDITWGKITHGVS
jgi:hypothetical protein